MCSQTSREINRNAKYSESIEHRSLVIREPTKYTTKLFRTSKIPRKLQ